MKSYYKFIDELQEKGYTVGGYYKNHSGESYHWRHETLPDLIVLVKDVDKLLYVDSVFMKITPDTSIKDIVEMLVQNTIAESKK